MSLEFPEHAGELSTHALNQSIEILGRALKDHPDEDVRKALGVIRLVAPYPRRVPWYGASMAIPGQQYHVDVGTVLLNAFEAVGDSVDALGSGGTTVNTRRHWFTQRYAGAWLQGRRDYYDFLDHLTDPLRWEEEDRKSRLTQEQAAAERDRITRILRERP